MSSFIYGEVVRDATTAFFFDGTARDEFAIFLCDDCGQHSGPQEIQCPHCGSPSLTPAAASGDATLVSWIVLHERDRDDPAAVFRKPVAVGQLSEGPWWWATLVGADPDALREGDPLRIDYVDVAHGERLPVFRPAGPRVT